MEKASSVSGSTLIPRSFASGRSLVRGRSVITNGTIDCGRCVHLCVSHRHGSTRLHLRDPVLIYVATFGQETDLPLTGLIRFGRILP